MSDSPSLPQSTTDDNDPELQMIKSERQDPTYFAMIPKMATLDLVPNELALYCNYKQTCGEFGSCTKSNATLATETHMSIRSVQRARANLEKKNYIRIEHHEDDGIENVPPTVIVRDVWEINHNLFSTQKAFVERTPHATQSYPMPHSHTPHVTKSHKEEPDKKIKEKDSVATKKVATVGEKPKAKTKRAPDPMYDAVHKVWGYTAALNGEIQKMLQGTSKRKGFKEYNLETAVSPEELLEWSGWYRETVLHGDDSLNMLEDRLKVQSSITSWQDERFINTLAEQEEADRQSLAERRARAMQEEQMLARGIVAAGGSSS